MKKLSFIIFMLSFLFIGLNSCTLFSKMPSADKEDSKCNSLLNTNMDTVSYMIGSEIGTSFKTNFIDIQPTALLAGVEAALQGNDTLFTEEEKNEIMTTFQFQLQMAEMERQEKVAAANRIEQDSFLTQNKKKEGILETPSGIQYKIITLGTGPKPLETDTVRVHYEGRFIDGEIFDASRKHGTEPVEFPLNRVISGWTQGLQLMPVGSTFELYIPAHLAYGERGNDRIPPSKMLIFIVELLDIVNEE